MGFKKILELNGIFAVRKPTGETSARTVERVKNMLFQGMANTPMRELNQMKKKIKVGHGGTLDPLATGVLVIGLGSGCKALGKFLHNVGKSYKATAHFGVTYDTYDRTGVLAKTTPVDETVITVDSIKELLQSKFTGTIMQRPPVFSAIHVNGERAYDIARRQQKEGIAGGGDGEKAPLLELPAREVTINKIELISMELPEFVLEMDCTSGTYVRSVVYDMGEAFGCGAALWELQRTKQGPLTLYDCIEVDDVADLDLVMTAIKKSESIQKQQ